MSNRAVGAVHRKTNHAWRTGANLPLRTARTANLPRKDPYSGTCRVGTVNADEIVVYNGQPVSRRVTLFIREGRGFRRIRQTWSDPLTGHYSFDYIAAGTYFVIAEDYLQQKTIVGADPVQAVPMP